ncbi:MAG: rRNA maturation factor, partial [Rhodospirillales bacterium]|nr:rRNA maturation factor [Rhodospirillales bacterium]
MMAGFEIAVDLREPAWREITPDPAGYCAKIASEALEALGETGGELSVVLAEDEFIRGLNRDY